MRSSDQHFDAYAIYLLLEGATALFLGISTAVNLVYQVRTAHLNPLQLTLVGTAMEGTALLLQVPTGLFADIASRRLSIVLGVALLGFGGLVQGAFPVFALILLASALTSVGYCFLTGAEEAWIVGEVGEARIGQVFLRGSQVAQLGALVGILVGTGLGLIRLDLPILTGGALLLALALALALVMPEHRFARADTEARPSWHAAGAALRESVRLTRRSSLLLTILAVAAVSGMSSEGFDRLNVAFFLRDFTVPMLGPLKPVAWFGLMSAVATLLSLGAMELLRRRLRAAPSAVLTRTLVVLNGGLVLSLVGFGLAGSFAIALGAFWCVRVLRQCITPLYATWITENSTPALRATLISMTGQADALGQVAGGPLVGAIGMLRSLRAALVTTGVALVPALLLYTRALRTRLAVTPRDPVAAETPLAHEPR